MKPDWKDAPEWAKYLAMDMNGTYYWYENKPDCRYSREWMTNRFFGGKFLPAVPPVTNWKDSLEQRPEKTK